MGAWWLGRGYGGDSSGGGVGGVFDRSTEDDRGREVAQVVVGTEDDRGREVAQVAIGSGRADGPLRGGVSATRSGTVEGRNVRDVVLDTGCSHTIIHQDLIPSSKKVPGEAVTIRCSHGDIALPLPMSALKSRELPLWLEQPSHRRCQCRCCLEPTFPNWVSCSPGPHRKWTSKKPWLPLVHRCGRARDRKRKVFKMRKGVLYTLLLLQRKVAQPVIKPTHQRNLLWAEPSVMNSSLPRTSEHAQRVNRSEWIVTHTVS